MRSTTRPEVGLFDLERFESLYPERVQRMPPDPNDGFSVGRIRSIDVSYINSARARIDAWDARAQYETSREGLGKLLFSAIGTWQPTLYLATDAWDRINSEVNVSSDSPLKFAAAGGVTRMRGHWSIGWSTRYMSGYRVSRDLRLIENQGSFRVAKPALSRRRDAVSSGAFAGVLQRSVEPSECVQPSAAVRCGREHLRQSLRRSAPGELRALNRDEVLTRDVLLAPGGAADPRLVAVTLDLDIRNGAQHLEQAFRPIDTLHGWEASLTRGAIHFDPRQRVLSIDLAERAFRGSHS